MNGLRGIWRLGMRVAAIAAILGAIGLTISAYANPALAAELIAAFSWCG